MANPRDAKFPVIVIGGDPAVAEGRSNFPMLEFNGLQGQSGNCLPIFSSYAKLRIYIETDKASEERYANRVIFRLFRPELISLLKHLRTHYPDFRGVALDPMFADQRCFRGVEDPSILLAYLEEQETK